MKKIPDIVKYVQLSSVGEITENLYSGAFRIKVILTHDERFTIERTYKSMLPNDNGIDREITLRAAGIAELDSRIIESPAWWQQSRNGRDLVDKQPVYDLLIAVNEKYEEWLSELKSTSEK